MKKISLYIFISILLFPTFAQNNNLLSPENRLKFGNYLFSSKDYLRAVNEYQEYLKFENNDTIKFKFAFSLENMNRFNEAGENYKSLFFNSTLEDEARLYYLRLQAIQANYDNYEQLSQNTLYKPDSKMKQVEKLKLYNDYFILNKRISYDSLTSIFNQDKSSWFNDLYNQKNLDNKKSPMKSAILSSIIPGLGKIYTENYTDGITSFLVTGILSYVAYDNFKAKRNTRGWIFAGLAGYFYAGNVYGSYASAQIFNARIDLDFKTSVKKNLENNNYFIEKYDFLK